LLEKSLEYLIPIAIINTVYLSSLYMSLILQNQHIHNEISTVYSSLFLYIKVYFNFLKIFVFSCNKQLDFCEPQIEKSSMGQSEVIPLLLATVVIFSADLKSFLSHLLNVHFPITPSSLAFLKKKVIFLC
jgi:hypothetical protein